MVSRTRKGGLIPSLLVAPDQGRVLLFMAALMILFGWLGADARFSGFRRTHGSADRDQAVWIEVVSPGIPHHIRPFAEPPLRSALLKALGLPVPDTLEDGSIGRSCRAVIHRGSPRIVFRPLSGAVALSLGRPIDINLAAQEDLVRIPGIGPVTARRMIDERIGNGPFRSLDDLARVRGIGPETIDRIAPYITTENHDRFPGTSGPAPTMVPDR